MPVLPPDEGARGATGTPRTPATPAPHDPPETSGTPASSAARGPSELRSGEANDDERRRRSYDAAFRRAAVELATEDGARIADVAAELEISASTLRRWVRAETNRRDTKRTRTQLPDAKQPEPSREPEPPEAHPPETQPPGPEPPKLEPPEASRAQPVSSKPPPAPPPSGPPSEDGMTPPSDVETGSLVEGREPTVSDADRRNPLFDEPAMEGSRVAPSHDPLAPDPISDVLSTERSPDVTVRRPRQTPRAGESANPSSAPSREKAAAAGGQRDADQKAAGDDDAWDTSAEKQAGVRPDDPNVLAMLDAILEMFPKHLAAQQATDFTEPSPAAHRAAEPPSNRIPLHPGDDIFPGLSALVPSYRFPIILAFLLGAIGVSRFVPTDYALRPVALALHVISLVVAFGAVLVIDWHGLLWLFGRRGLTESTRLAAAAGPLIWGGLFGLIASGALLHPNISSPLTVIKLLLVLMVAWNGAAMSTLRRRMAQLPPYVKPTDLPIRDWAMLMTATVLSQIGWWGAIIIGFINSST